MTPSPTIHEVDFCSQMAAAINMLVAQNPTLFPFTEARVEGFGTGPASRKRKDLRFFDRFGKLVLCGEVKLPGTPEGQTAQSQKLMADASAKAENAGVQYFFTWNVNEFALWDRSKWDVPWFERRVHFRQLTRFLASPKDVAREENLTFVKTHFLPDMLQAVADFITGRRRDWTPPDEIFLRTLESHLNWPVMLTSTYLLEHADKERNKGFDLRVQQWMHDQESTFIRSPHEEWVKAVDNMAKTLAYVWANRLIFYKALRARFPDLPALQLKSSVKTPPEALAAFNAIFQQAVQRSGDYESLLMPTATDWATEVVFQPANALDAWRGLLRAIESVDFRQVPSDVVGKIFQKLIGPDERHRFGQHFTGDDVVDLINGFCIRNGSDTVLDPACGSGSFLVRAYYRKRHLDPTRPHLNLIGELFGCDIAMYPAHLATLNLAAREINDEANYPRIARRNFFDYAPPQPFCEIPDNAGSHLPIPLPPLDAVVGNPPYVRQEKVEKTEKTRYGVIAATAWPGLRLTGRADLHCYFWPAAARLLKPDGYFGFLTSSSWMDVEYGFALQGWMLKHFRILAVMESAAEPWFEDARVKTCAAILQRCDDQPTRMANTVRFVRFSRKLADIIGVAPTSENEDARQASIETLRQRILSADADHQDQDMRIIVKKQQDLWDDGVRAGEILGNVDTDALAEEYENGDDEVEEAASAPTTPAPEPKAANGNGHYHAGKWGRYVRAPDIYFDIMRRFGKRFVPMGAIADIRFGVKTGCDAFFMPKDITAKMLQENKTDRQFRENTGGAPRKDAESGKLKIILAGDGSAHPVEAKYLLPELHSMMKVVRPIVRGEDLDRLVLMVSGSMEKIKAQAPWVHRYLRYGISALFSSEKSKGKPVPDRPTCAARDPWYDLTALVRPGFGFWPKIQKYRHIVAENQDGTICNCNLYDISSAVLDKTQQAALLGILNSTIVGFFKAFYGRFAGTETTLKTEIVDVNVMEVPDPRLASPAIIAKIRDALSHMQTREVTHLVEAQLLECHSPERAKRLGEGPLMFAEELMQPDRRNLDDAVLEILGVSNRNERAILLEDLYKETAKYFREGRIVEIQAMENRSNADQKRFNVHDLAADIWDAADLDEVTPLGEWVSQQTGSNALVNIPDERPAALSQDMMFDPNTVFFGKSKRSHVTCATRGQAELVARLASLGATGDVKMPTALDPALKLLDRVNVRFEKARLRFQELAESRTGDERVRLQLLEVLQRWFVLGREPAKPATQPLSAPP